METSPRTDHLRRRNGRRARRRRRRRARRRKRRRSGRFARRQFCRRIAGSRGGLQVFVAMIIDKIRELLIDVIDQILAWPANRTQFCATDEETAPGFRLVLALLRRPSGPHSCLAVGAGHRTAAAPVNDCHSKKAFVKIHEDVGRAESDANTCHSTNACLEKRRDAGYGRFRRQQFCCD